MTVDRYLDLAAVAYDAACPDLRTLAPRDKYRRRADTRHGGMLDLPAGDADAFSGWFSSREWSGAHPWEIVFAHPHGILLSPTRREDGWRFFLSVDTLGLYVTCALMAITLGENDTPFELFGAEKIVAALEGNDLVEVGPFFGQLALDELRSERPDAVPHVV